MKNLMNKLFGTKKDTKNAIDNLELVIATTPVQVQDAKIELAEVAAYVPVVKQYLPTDKTIDLLIVEDNPKHMADARALVDEKIAAGKKIHVQYAKTYVQAEKMMQENAFDGIICDVFFPYTEEELRNNEIAEKTYQVLAKKGKVYIRDKTDNWDPNRWAPMENWRTGKTPDIAAHLDNYKDDPTIPLGVLVAEAAKEKQVPLVFCTDTNHHGYKTEPVNQYCHKQHIALVDTYKDNQHGVAAAKKWHDALNYVVDEALYQLIAKEDVKKHEAIRAELDKYDVHTDYIQRKQVREMTEYKQMIKDLDDIGTVKKEIMPNYV